MQQISSVPRTRRARRRQAAWGTLLWVGLGTLAAVAALASYRVGLSQGTVEIARLKADLAAQHELNRLAGERAAAAEQQAEAAIARHAQLLVRQRSEAPGPELRRLSELAAERLRAGVPASRLEFVIAQSAPEPACERELETRGVAVRTPADTGPVAAATFFDGRVIVTAEGAAAAAAAEFDPARPVSLRFLEIGGEVATVSGPLPLAQSLTLEGQELRFAARAGGRRGSPELEVSAQRCALP